jgi:integrase
MTALVADMDAIFNAAGGAAGGTTVAAGGLAEAASRAAGLAEGARAEATRRAYRSDWAHFDGWCRDHGLVALPAAPETVGLYLAAHATVLAVATLTRRLSTIATAQRMAGHQLDSRHPAIRDVMRGLRRARGTAQRHAEALTTDRLRRLLATCGDRLIDTRDRALLLVGFAAALRRSELVALDVADVAVAPEGLRVTIRRSKGDQEGAGQVVAIGRTGSPTCPVAAYEGWIAAAEITEGRAFRAVDRHGRVADRLSTNAVAGIVQRRAALAGLDAAAFSGHSMRAGFATSAAAVGVEEREIMRQTRHRSTEVLRRYIREGVLFARNMSLEVGL